MLDPNDNARVSALESRVTALETQIGYLNGRVERAEGKLDSFAERITRAEEKISHLPSKGFIVSAVMIALGLFGSIVLLQANIRSLIGITTPAIPISGRP